MTEAEETLADAREAIRSRPGGPRASAVVLQTRLGIGYARGDLGPDTPTGAREIRFK